MEMERLNRRTDVAIVSRRSSQTATTNGTIALPASVPLSRSLGQVITSGGKTLFNAGYRPMLSLLLIWLASGSALRSQSAVPTTTSVVPPSAYLIPALPSHVVWRLSPGMKGKI
jgi:hypothetical protein